MRSLSMKRLAFYVAVTGLAGVVLGLAGGLMEWSYGVSFVTTTVVGSAISLAALRENPLDWYRHFRQQADQRNSRA